MSSVLPWIIGAVVLVLLGILAARRGRRPESEVTVDRARSLLSQLDLAIDQAQDDAPADTLAEVRRLHLLAGAALAGDPGPADARRSAALSGRALRLLG